MKIWKIETLIETEDSWDKTKILSELDLFFNRGDGAYIDIEPEKCKLKLVKSVSRICWWDKSATSFCIYKQIQDEPWADICYENLYDTFSQKFLMFSPTT